MSSMSDFTWYSRLMVWTGCAVLLLESVLGRSFGYATVIAVILASTGLLGFVGGLATEGYSGRLPLLEGTQEVSPEAVEPTSPLHKEPAPPPADALPVSAEVQPPHVIRPQPAVTPPAGEVEPVAVASADVADSPSSVRTTAQPARREGATTIALEGGDNRTAAACMACQQPLRGGQLAAACNECSALHHAHCWMENRFHCAREGCAGHGALLAPDDAPEA